MQRARRLLALLLALPLVACRAEVAPVPNPALEQRMREPAATSGESGADSKPDTGGMLIEPPPHESEEDMTRTPPPHPGDDAMVTVPPPAEPQPPRPAPQPKAQEVQR